MKKLLMVVAVVFVFVFLPEFFLSDNYGRWTLYVNYGSEKIDVWEASSVHGSRRGCEFKMMLNEHRVYELTCRPSWWFAPD